MPRSVSLSFRHAVEAQHTDDVDLIFATITHPQLVEPVRVVNDTKDFIRDGVTFVGFPFDIQLLSDDDNPPKAQLEIQNVDRRIGQTILPLTTPPRLKIELLSSADFDLTVVPRVALGSPGPSPEYVADFLFLQNVQVDALTVSADIVGWDYTQVAWPSVRATQSRLPGLFR